MITIKTTTFPLVAGFKADDNTLATGLTPTVTIYETDGTVVVNAQTMTEIANGGYFYNVTGLTTNTSYYGFADGGATLTTFRYQPFAFYTNFGNEDVIDTIDTNTQATNTTVQTNLDTKVSTIGSGDGDIPVEFLLEVNSVPRPGERIWVTSDASGLNLKSSKSLVTNSSAIRQWTLKATTYYIWIGSSNVYFGTLQVVSATDVTFTANPNFND